MNILILSCGSRVKLVEYFKKELDVLSGTLYATDCSELAPALYRADEYLIVPRITEEGYIDTILKICKEKKIDGVLSLIDPELSLLAENREEFESIGTKVIVSDYESTEICLDKMKMHDFLIENNINTVKSYVQLEEVKTAVNKNIISYPLFVKPVCGSASLNMTVVYNEVDLNQLISLHPDEFIIQEYVDGKEYGTDVYVDFISNEVVSVFTKEKIKMRAGETDKSVSVNNENITKLVTDTVTKLGLKGPLDVDVFEKDGKFLISEINPRFGGGYLHAHESGVNHVELILNNIQRKINGVDIKACHQTVMLKYSSVYMLNSGV